MADWGDYYSDQRVDSLARLVTLRHDDASVGGSIHGMCCFNTVTPLANLLPATLSYLMFHPLESAARYRDPNLSVKQ